MPQSSLIKLAEGLWMMPNTWCTLKNFKSKGWIVTSADSETYQWLQDHALTDGGFASRRELTRTLQAAYGSDPDAPWRKHEPSLTWRKISANIRVDASGCWKIRKLRSAVYTADGPGRWQIECLIPLDETSRRWSYISHMLEDPFISLRLAMLTCNQVQQHLDAGRI